MSLHHLFDLGERLHLCASMVRPKALLVDIGTDHAYLPIWLAKQNLIANAIAADINIGPLRKAEQNIKRYHVSDVVSARLSNGLDAILPFEANDIVIAGMGGETIIKIISAANWIKDTEKQLILQPMTSVQQLREFLAVQNFSILTEQAVVEDNRVYSVILAKYDSAGVSVGKLYPYIGKLNAETQDNRAYMRRRVTNLEKKAKGLVICGKKEEADTLCSIVENIKSMIEKGQSDDFNR